MDLQRGQTDLTITSFQVSRGRSVLLNLARSGSDGRQVTKVEGAVTVEPVVTKVRDQFSVPQV